MLTILYNIFVFPIEIFIDFLFKNIYVITLGNVFLSIFFVSFCVNLICLPMYARAEKFQTEEREIQKKLAPKVESIKRNFRGDERFLLLRTYYRQNGYHPVMALRSSLSLLIQIPFFAAAYIFFSHLEMLDGQALWVVQNLGAPDGLINFFGLKINALPLLMTLVNLLASEIYAKNLAAKEKIQMYSLAAVFLVLLYNSPSGLVIYWTLNNLFSLVKNVGLTKKSPKKFLKNVLLAVSAVFFADIIVNICKYSFAYTNALKPYIASILLVLAGAFLYKKLKPAADGPEKPDTPLFLATGVALALWTGFLIPSVIISSDPIAFSNIGSVKNPISFILFAFTQCFGLFVFWAATFYFFFENKVKTALTTVLSVVLGIFAYNTMTFGADAGSLSVDLKLNTSGLALLRPEKILENTLICLFAAAVILFFSAKRKKKILRNFTAILLAFCLIYGGFGVFKIEKTYRADFVDVPQNRSDETELSLSTTEKNVLVLFFDRTLGCYVKQALDENPELKKSFSGFVFYPNTVSFGPSTYTAYPAMAGGYEYTPHKLNIDNGQKIRQKYHEAVAVLPVLFEQNGFSSTVVNRNFSTEIYKPRENDILAENGVKVYSARFFTDGFIEKTRKTFDFDTNLNILKMKNRLFGDEVVKSNLFAFSRFVCTPSAFKKGHDLNKAHGNDGEKIFANRRFADYFALAALKNLTTTRPGKGSLVFFNNDFLHIDKYDDAYVSEHLEVHKEAVRQLAIYFDALKKLGVYDNTRIIVVSDHGHWGQVAKNLDEEHTSFNPVLMVKDFGQNAPLTYDYDFMTNADMPIFATNGIIKNPRNPFTHKLLSSSVDKNEIDVITGWRWSKLDFLENTKFYNNSDIFFTVRENIFDQNKWKVKNGK